MFQKNWMSKQKNLDPPARGREHPSKSEHESVSLLMLTGRANPPWTTKQVCVYLHEGKLGIQLKSGIDKSSTILCLKYWAFCV